MPKESQGLPDSHPGPLTFPSCPPRECYILAVLTVCHSLNTNDSFLPLCIISHCFLGVLVYFSCYDKIPQTRGLDRNLFLTVLESAKSKTKVPADSISGEDLLQGL